MKNDLANSVVAIFRDVEIPARIQRDTEWAVEARARRRPAIAREATAATARHGRDDPRRRSNLANSVVAIVRDVEIAARIQRDASWLVEARACRRPAIAPEAIVAIARHGRDDPCRRSDLANSVVILVRDVEIAARIQRDSGWDTEALHCRQSTVGRVGL